MLFVLLVVMLHDGGNVLLAKCGTGGTGGELLQDAIGAECGIDLR
jgi:hypothetical protein